MSWLLGMSWQRNPPAPDFKAGTISVSKCMRTHEPARRREARRGAARVGQRVLAMKTVLFCGGLVTRIRDYKENVPKPMIPLDRDAAEGRLADRRRRQHFRYEVGIHSLPPSRRDLSRSMPRELRRDPDASRHHQLLQAAVEIQCGGLPPRRPAFRAPARGRARCRS
jgi:hypothetical protein